MKQNIGSQLALYPTPATVVGAMNGEKPTWTLVAHVGILGHDHVLVSLASAHFINGCIKQSRKLSINLVDESMLPQVDVSGSVSGAKEDKSHLFAYELGASGAPVIQAAPLTMECTVTDIYPTDGFARHLADFCRLDRAGQERMRGLLLELDLSARAYDRVLKVARTVADLAGADDVREEHVLEASTWRELDRAYWN